MDKAERRKVVEFAREALKEGVSLSVISKITQLPINEIEKLAKGEEIEKEEE